MSTGGMAYSETNDLYMQMLSEARRLEDKRLAKMILRRILDHQQALDMPEPLFSNIVSMPTMVVESGPMESEVPFWTQGRFWQDLFQFLSFLSVGMSWMLYFFYLLHKA